MKGAKKAITIMLSISSPQITMNYNMHVQLTWTLKTACQNLGRFTNKKALKNTDQVTKASLCQ